VSSKSIALRFFLFPLGIALLWTAFLFQGGTALNAEQVVLTPTPDRLAEPTLSPAKTQADYGAQVFWLYCLPCHGDRGQGLTDEFRQLYPPDHQDCWKSGCHGNRPYTNGFILPTVVPRLIGDGALNNFSNAAQLYGFISSAMPFQAPGTLTSEQYYQIVAFLLRQNGLWDGRTEVNASNASRIHISSEAAASTPAPNVAPIPYGETNNGSWMIFAGGALSLILILSIWLLIRKKR
jgi:cytochrome c